MKLKRNKIIISLIKDKISKHFVYDIQTGKIEELYFSRNYILKNYMLFSIISLFFFTYLPYSPFLLFLSLYVTFIILAIQNFILNDIFIVCSYREDFEKYIDKIKNSKLEEVLKENNKYKLFLKLKNEHKSDKE